MRTILTYGTFDLFHVGHVNLLKTLRGLGDRLVVGCSTDDFNSIKGKKSVIPYNQRVDVLMACRYVDEVVPEFDWNQKRNDIERLGVDILGMGDDWAGKFDFLNDQCKVIYLPRTQNISSTELRQIVKHLHLEDIRRVRSAVEQISHIIDSIES